MTEGVNPADLSVYGVALTQDLSPSKRVTNADVAVCIFGRATFPVDLTIYPHRATRNSSYSRKGTSSRHSRG